MAGESGDVTGQVLYADGGWGSSDGARADHRYH